MRRLLALITLALVAAIPFAPARADQAPTISGKPDASEAVFVRAIQADLPKRFATPAAAERAGYVRYTNEDDTGAISYANMAWESTDAKHPSQLWYDVHGNLLGADFSTLKSNAGAARPHKWGIQPGRWTEFDDHIHYVAIDPATGKTLYDKYVPTAQWVKAGGDPTEPKPETLVKLGLVKHASDVVTVFLFPTIWDLIVWVKPNPDGAFADKNPLVTPSSK
jgi:hypothetical protein